MCGILGIFRYETFSTKEEKEEVSRIIAKLLVGSQERGESATGISLINTHTDTIRIFKLPIKASKFVRKSKFWKEMMRSEYNLVLGHTRTPTIGDPKDNDNNHPIFDTKNNNVLVHNGGVPNYKELRQEYKFKPLGEVDSEVILAMFNRKNRNIREALKELEGGMAIALYDQKMLYLYRKTSPLNVTYFPEKNLWMFASEEVFIHNAVTKRKDLNVLYKVWKFEDRLKGYVTYSNYDMSNNEMFTITFDKEVGIKLSENIESKERVYICGGGNRGDWKDEWDSNRRGLSQLFDGTKKNCDRCNKCIYKYCRDRDTWRAEACKDNITTKQVSYIGNGFLMVKNKGVMRQSVFDIETLINEGILDNAESVDEDELALQGKPGQRDMRMPMG